MLDPGTKSNNNNNNHVARLSDHLARIANANSHISYGIRARKTAENYANHVADEDEDSGVSTPPLWRSASPPRKNNYRCLSPNSRTQAIARGQRELMEMVSRMPEGCYELSLKDIVEVNKQESFSKDRGVNDGDFQRREPAKKKKKKIDQKGQMKRSGSIDNGGFLLKMVFPISWSPKKKKKNGNSNLGMGTNSSSKDGRIWNSKDVKLSPKPLLNEGSEKSADQEWWKNRFSVSEESESGGLSSNSGSSKSSGSGSSRSSSRNSKHGNGGCWPVILFKRGKRKE